MRAPNGRGWRSANTRGRRRAHGPGALPRIADTLQQEHKRVARLHRGASRALWSVQMTPDSTASLYRSAGTSLRYAAGACMVLYCTAIHVIWACLILENHAATGATPVSALASLFKSDGVLAAVLLLVAALSIVGLISRMPWAVALLMPQQSLLLISAFGAAAAIISAQYADGVIRPQEFIAADQAGVILAAPAHAIAIIISTYDRVAR